MKTCLVVLGGGADRPHPALRGETPLRRARLPHLESLIRDGRLGTVRTTPPGREPGFETALPLLLGYAPGSIPAAGPLEALGTGRALRPDESAFLADFVTLRDGVLVDPSGGRPREAEAGVLRDAVNAALGGTARLEAGSATWRNVLLVAAEGAEATTVSSPHALSGLLLRGKEPVGPAGARLEEILRRAEGALAPHEVNAIRVDLRENPANALWCWGGGRAPALEPASERVGGRLVVVSRGGYARGLAEASGCEWVDAGPDEGQAAARALAALDGGADAAVLLLRSAEGASLTGDAGRKVAELERVDASVVGPLREGLAARGDHRLAACADVVLSTLDRRAFPDPVPFALAGTGVPPSPGRGAAAFTEEAAAASDLSVDAAEDFLAYVMGR